MAQRTSVVLISDLTGEEMEPDEGENVQFGLDGVTYEVDLFTDQAKSLREALAPFVEAGRRTGGRVQRGRAPSKSAGNRMSREQANAIRTWARGQGMSVADRGRIPGEVVQKFEAAH